VVDVSSSDEALKAVRESREKLETLAESDLRSAKWAKRLLDAMDGEGADREGSS
jgi:hypothetical protein